MTGEPIIERKSSWLGFHIEKHRHSDRLGFLPEFFWVARAGDQRSCHDGYGNTRGQAIANAESKLLLERKAA